MSAEQAQRYSPLWHLTLTRLREFFRQPEAVFWVYGFPLLLAVALGIAFRNRPVERINVDIQSDGIGQAQIDSLTESLSNDERIHVTVSNKEEAQERLQRGKTDLILVPTKKSDGNWAFDYWLEPNRAESVLARSAVDSALVRANSSETSFDVSDKTIEVPGSRYIDFLIPGLVGMNVMGGGLWGVGFVTVDLRVRKQLKRYLATPMRKQDFLFSLMLSRLL